VIPSRDPEGIGLGRGKGGGEERRERGRSGVLVGGLGRDNDEAVGRDSTDQARRISSRIPKIKRKGDGRKRSLGKKQATLGEGLVGGGGGGGKRGRGEVMMLDGAKSRSGGLRWNGMYDYAW
jgi:hypothetical protein